MGIHAQHATILEQGLWFRSRCKEFKRDVLECATIKKFASGSTLFHRGDANNGVFAIVSGSVRISGLNSEGKESILTFIEPPDWFGELALFDGEERTHDAVVVSDASLLHIPKAPLDSLLKREPRYWRDFGIMLSHKLRLSFSLIEDMALLPAPKRLAKRILMMIENIRANQITNESSIRVDQSSLAAMLSISRQTANQILKDLEAQGLISLDYGKITVLDRERLARFVIET